jgi:beta-glucosidase
MSSVATEGRQRKDTDPLLSGVGSAAEAASGAAPLSPLLFTDVARTKVAQMSLREKASVTSGASFWWLQSVRRLGIEGPMVCDGPHGLRKDLGASHLGLDGSVPATCFPTASALGASWDRKLVQQVGEALGRECVANQVSVLLGPGVNMKRHPLCGRNFEYISEDPHVAGELGAAFVAGVQSRGIGTSLKHYAVNNQEFNRMGIDTLVDERTLREYYLPAFEAVVRKAQPWTVMAAYNRLNGTFCSEHHWLLSTVLRGEWGFKGLVVTDWGAVNDRVAGVLSGCDLEMPSSGGHTDRALVRAVRSGKLAEPELDVAAQRVTALCLVGAAQQQMEEQADLDQHHALARRAAAECAVLLKNETRDGAKLLPLRRSNRIALIGGFAEAPRFQGTGSSKVNAHRVDLPLAAIREAVDGEGEVVFSLGYDAVHAATDAALIEEAAAAATAADCAVVIVGLTGAYEAEAVDREHMDLPEQMNQLVSKVMALDTYSQHQAAQTPPYRHRHTDTAPDLSMAKAPKAACCTA